MCKVQLLCVAQQNFTNRCNMSSWFWGQPYCSHLKKRKKENVNLIHTSYSFLPTIKIFRLKSLCALNALCKRSTSTHILTLWIFIRLNLHGKSHKKARTMSVFEDMILKHGSKQSPLCLKLEAQFRYFVAGLYEVVF